ncbi:MAG: hypothetical protein K8I82_24630, partial [Anaerolineae bacterium]|nr:hypothetical protein [Anaerolineae bacterium]
RDKVSKLDVNNNLISTDQQSRIIALPQRLIFAYIYDEHIYAFEAKQNDKLNIKNDRIELVSVTGGASTASGEQNSTTWKREKVSNIYWLGSDLMNTLCGFDADTPTHIIRNIHHINSHAHALNLDQVTLGKTQALFNRAKDCKDWNSKQERAEIYTGLQELYKIIEHIMDTADPDYKPDQI